MLERAGDKEGEFCFLHYTFLNFLLSFVLVCISFYTLKLIQKIISSEDNEKEETEVEKKGKEFLPLSLSLSHFSRPMLRPSFLHEVSTEL